jgi:hypothetical protein
VSLIFAPWRSPCIALLSLALVACASRSAEDTGLDLGGQTGSLIPDCLTPEETPYVVPEGDTAFAQQLGAGFIAAQLTDPAGNPVAVTESREGKTSILRTDQVLTPGTYTLTGQCAEFGEPVMRVITVVEAAPLPEDFGGIESTPLVPTPLCSEHSDALLTWTPPDDFVPYLSLAELTLYEGTQKRGVLARSGPYEMDTRGRVEVRIPLCPAETTCLDGKGTYHLEARVAGEEATWLSEALEIDPLCRRDPIADNPGPCSLLRPGSRGVNRLPAYLLLLTLLGAHIGIRRRGSHV